MSRSRSRAHGVNDAPALGQADLDLSILARGPGPRERWPRARQADSVRRAMRATARAATDVEHMVTGAAVEQADGPGVDRAVAARHHVPGDRAEATFGMAELADERQRTRTACACACAGGAQQPSAHGSLRTTAAVQQPAPRQEATPSLAATPATT